jgi:two-component sensor histidine kinase
MDDVHFAYECQAYELPEYSRQTVTGYHGLLALPIIFFGAVQRLIGVISVQSIIPRMFTTEEKNFVEVVAGILAINMENSRLYTQTDEQLQQKMQELATIHRVSSAIASTLNLDEVLQIIATQAVMLSSAERSCIFELDADKKFLRVLAHYGLSQKTTSEGEVAVEICCAGRTVASGKPNIIRSTIEQDKECFQNNDPGVSSEINAILCVPLKVKRHVLGCICIYSNNNDALHTEQTEVLMTFANEAAIAIENARLYDETRHGLEMKTILLRELHHRVKNNLATVAGILSLQRRRTKSDEVETILGESINRVQSLAATHDLLSHEEWGETKFEEVARKIIGLADTNLKPLDAHINFLVEPCAIVVPAHLVTILALVLNEMVSNAIKHGISDTNKGTILIRGYQKQNWIIIEVLDSGQSLLSTKEETRHDGLGLSLIRQLTGDMKGTFSLEKQKVLEYTHVGKRKQSNLWTIAQICIPIATMRSLAPSILHQDKSVPIVM